MTSSCAYRVPANSGFTVGFELRNRDARRMPWGPGHHFYFTLPWHGNLTRGRL